MGSVFKTADSAEFATRNNASLKPKMHWTLELKSCVWMILAVFSATLATCKFRPNLDSNPDFRSTSWDVWPTGS